jgi:hypothetical protein
VISHSVHWECLFPSTALEQAQATDCPAGLPAGNSRYVLRHRRALAHPLRRLPSDQLGPAPVGGELKRYEYPRYFFSNKSMDILGLCCAALDRLGIAYRRPRWDRVWVARREAVAALDVWVGPKA